MGVEFQYEYKLKHAHNRNIKNIESNERVIVAKKLIDWNYPPNIITFGYPIAKISEEQANDLLTHAVAHEKCFIIKYFLLQGVDHFVVARANDRHSKEVEKVKCKCIKVLKNKSAHILKSTTNYSFAIADLFNIIFGYLGW